MKRGFIDGEYQDGELRGLTFLAGKRGMGKTTEMFRLLSACSGGWVFFDTVSKHENIVPGAAVVNEPGQLRNYLRANVGKRFRVIYQPRQGSLDAHFSAVCELVLGFGWMIFAIDEIDKLCGPRYGDSRMPTGLYDIVNYGRHHRVSAIASARRPQRVPRDFTGECWEMRLFRLTEADVITYFQEYIGRDQAQRLRALDKYQFLLWQDGADDVKLCGGKRR